MLPNRPIIMVDTDVLIDMTPWDHVAKAKDWEEFFSHIPEAKLRNGELLPLLELAKSSGAWLSYSSRVWNGHRGAVRGWMETNKAPRGSLYMRTVVHMPPATVAFNHARLIATRGLGERPVFMIHNDEEIAAKLRRRGIAALGVGQIPTTEAGFMAILKHARKIANTKPKVDANRGAPSTGKARGTAAV